MTKKELKDTLLFCMRRLQKAHPDIRLVMTTDPDPQMPMERHIDCIVDVLFLGASEVEVEEQINIGAYIDQDT